MNTMQDKKPYRRSQRHGLWEWYWTNGNLCNIGNYINGEQFGLWIRYYYESNLKDQIYYAR